MQFYESKLNKPRLYLAGPRRRMTRLMVEISLQAHALPKIFKSNLDDVCFEPNSIL